MASCLAQHFHGNADVGKVMESIANSLLHDVALVALCRGWPETLPLAALAKLPEPIETDEPDRVVVRVESLCRTISGSRDMESRQCAGDFKQIGNVGSLFSLLFKGHRARYLDCPRQIARTIDAHRPGISHLDFKPAESCPRKQPCHLSARI